MRRRQLTLTVIPEAGGKAYSMALPHFVLFLALAVLLSSLVALAVLVKSGVEKTANASAARMQSKENRIITQKIEDFNSELILIAAKIETLKTLEGHIRELSNIEYVPEGTRPPQEESDGEWIEQSEEAVSERLEKLLRETSATRESFEELVESVGDMEHLLNHTPSIRPASGWLISGYGHTENPFTGRTEMHMGVDIAALEGTPIYATADGRVAFVGHKPGYGLTVVIDHGSSLSTWYGHCSMAKVITGEVVKRGTVIASIGKSGQAIGPHVQYEIRVAGEPVDPAGFFLDEPGAEN